MDLSRLKQLEQVKLELKEEFKNISDVALLEDLRVKYLGKKGVLKQLTNQLSDLSVEDKKSAGVLVNELKQEIETNLDLTFQRLKNIKKEDALEDFIKTLPGKKPAIGHLHVITQAIREITEIFKPLGFTRVRYPEVDWEYYAFEALNIPATHPARDEWETFFIDAPADPKMGRIVITPHTSSGQVREMLKGSLPIRMLNISRCGRRQIDVSHNPTFFQFEGLVVDKGINISHLKGVLTYFVKNFYGPDREIRLRPYNFRFTEPSFEIDISCGICGGSGCKLCKGGWLELGGAGMVHPKVLEYGGVDSANYSGFAFGWGVERTYMMKSGAKIDDIRHLLGNDLKFLEQF